MEVSSRLTVLFEDPFWVAIYEKTENGVLRAARVVFGAEPKDSDVYAYFLQNWNRPRFSPGVAAGKALGKAMNPKRLQRQIHRQIAPGCSGTKAQQALKLLQEQNKHEHRQKSKAIREAEAQKKFELRRQKRKQKHKGK